MSAKTAMLHISCSGALKICLCQDKFRKKIVKCKKTRMGAWLILTSVARFNFTNKRNWIQHRSMSRQMMLATGQIFNNLLPPSIFCDFIMVKSLLSNFYHKDGCLRHMDRKLFYTAIWIEKCFISTKRRSRHLLGCKLYYLTHVSCSS